MKKTIMTLLVVIAAITLTNNLSAQYSIPSYNVPVVADPTTFEEIQRTTVSYNNPVSQQLGNRGRRKLIIKVKDNNSSSTATETINIYSLDGSFLFGPYTVSEGSNFEIDLDDDLDWGLCVLQATPDSEMDVWFE